MCEIFGITADRKVRANELLREFFSHSSEHKDGWGLAVFDAGYPEVEKEPVPAEESSYLKARLSAEFSAAHMAAHIRRATCGIQEYVNTHPFVRKDSTGRIWTLVHNGQIFEGPSLRRYLNAEEGSTDSERILCCIADEAGRLYTDDGNSSRGGRTKSGALTDLAEQDGRAASGEFADPGESDRIRLVEEITRRLAPENKLNFILYDGDLMYVHANEPGGIYVKIGPHSRIFSTRPLTCSGWEVLPSNRLHVYRDAEEIYTGDPHGFTFVYDPEKEQDLYMNYSML